MVRKEVWYFWLGRLDCFWNIMNLFWLDSLLKEYVVRPPNDFFLIDYSCLGDIEFNSIFVFVAFFMIL